MDYLPINLNIKDKRCLVVGGGNIALRKSKQLLNAGADLVIVSPEFHAEFVELSATNQLVLIRSEYYEDLLNDKMLVVAATDNKKTNQAVYANAEQRGILVNVVDQPALCRFIMPSVIDRSPLTIAISSGGSAPVFARMLRENIEWLLPKNIGAFLSRVNKDRNSIAERYPKMSERRRFWESFFEEQLGWSVSDNIADEAPVELNLDYELDESKSDKHSNNVTLVDLGNTKIENLTIRTIKVLQKTDSVYLSKSNYKCLKDIIRRDADIYLIDEQEIDLTYLKALSKSSIFSSPENAQQVVILKSGHSFETNIKAYSDIFQSLPDWNYQRIAAINECCPL